MALQKTLTLVDNFNELVVFDNAYIQIAKVETSKITSIATVLIRKSSSSQILKTQIAEFSIDLEGPNPIKQAYLHLKSLPEFSDAVDC
jgi:hypothetical protein